MPKTDQTPQTYLAAQRKVPFLATRQQDGRMLKAAEMIEVQGKGELSLADQQLYNALLRHAHGPAMSDPRTVFQALLPGLRETQGRHGATTRIADRRRVGDYHPHVSAAAADFSNSFA